VELYLGCSFNLLLIQLTQLILRQRVLKRGIRIANGIVANPVSASRLQSCIHMQPNLATYSGDGLRKA